MGQSLIGFLGKIDPAFSFLTQVNRAGFAKVGRDDAAITAQESQFLSWRREVLAPKTRLCLDVGTNAVFTGAIRL